MKGADLHLVVRAADFAARRHVNQKRKGLAGEPYFNHLAEVAMLLATATGGEDDYVEWVERVVAGCRDLNADLEKSFDAAAADARAAIAAG